MKNNFLFTSESVTEGHPDKMCDVISDSILDAYIKKDKNARVACEVTATTGVISVMGEITSNAGVDISQIVRETVSEIGYEGDCFGFDGQNCAVMSMIDKQSDDIDLGVSLSLEARQSEKANGEEAKESLGAGDQGMMFGFACNETDVLMPAPIYYANLLSQQLTKARKNKCLDYLGPDGKSMITFEYQDGKPMKIDTIVISTQHLLNVKQEKIYQDVIKYVIHPIIPQKFIDSKTKILVNPTGRFVKGGPCADTGLTGRKIIVDTYGGMGRHGGGAFSGKDPTKVDRTGAYAARYVAKNIIAADIADKCEVQIAYAIGVSNPVSVHVNTFNTAKIPDQDIAHMISEIFDLRPAALIEQFSMRGPIYKQLSAYGHFGRTDIDAAWERTDKVDQIQAYLK
ncbi:methionine adenosyltransferase [Vallitalea pronyensis]|uniref:S-adenosylmethionine synthase n=1 Tax=Vallitalea pronyensis TaxID=1348613 RepID=A0A8J8SFZ7_9FIRM|nr:methionine adenosyltransferase [Vallitalea pronyensis]QUI21854.1 methionine adenosyltransferase [Vallitalea pronyensis]